MNVYTVRDLSRDRSRKELTNSALEAAEQAARYWFHQDPVEHFDRLEVFGNGGTFAFEVEVIPVPHFEVKRIQPDPPVPSAEDEK